MADSISGYVPVHIHKMKKPFIRQRMSEKNANKGRIEYVIFAKSSLMESECSLNCYLLVLLNAALAFLAL